jgi:hypothetical protein
VAGTPVSDGSSDLPVIDRLTQLEGGAMFQPVFSQRFYWLPLALVSVLWALRRQELRDRYLRGLTAEDLVA